MTPDEETNTPQPKMKRNYLPIILLLICFAASALAGAWFASSSIFDGKNPVRRIISSDDDEEEELIKATEKVTILIMGVDIRKDDVGRSDTLMIATVDPKLDKATLLSIPRDTRVKIRGRGYDKINAAFAYGGVNLTESTVENFLGIDIDHYITIDTGSFVKIIDAIGGIDIDVEKRMYYEDPWDDNGGLVIDLYPGQQHMDGKTAVTYVRYRDSEGDIGRVKRQQAFMAACMDKVTSPEIVPRIPKIVREVIDAVETDMSLRQLLEVAGTLKSAAQNGLDTDMVPGYPLYIDDISYWIPDVEEVRISVADALGIAVDPYLRERFERAAREYNNSIPVGAKDVPDDDDTIGRPVRDSRDYRRSTDRRNSIDERGYYSNRRSTADERDRYSERASTSDERDGYSERTNTSDERDRYSEPTSTVDEYDRPFERTSTYDERERSSESRRYEPPTIERRTIPDVDEPSEPTRDSTSKTRY